MIGVTKKPGTQLWGWALGALALLLSFCYRAQLTATLLPFLYALLLAYLLSPLVAYLEKKNLPRHWAIFFVYLLLTASLVLLVLYVIPLVVAQINGLIKQLALFSEGVLSWLLTLDEQIQYIELPQALLDSVEYNVLRLQGGFENLLNFLAQFVINLFSSTITIILVPILAFYMLKDYRAILKISLNLFPAAKHEFILEVLQRIDLKLGAWVRGQVFIGLLTGALIFVGLKLAGMDYALGFAFLVAVLNFVPYFGPIIAALPSIFVGFLKAPILGVKVLLVQVVVQHFESTVLVPHILGKELGLHPLIIMLALLLGSQFAGVIGLVLAAPAVAIIIDLVSYWRQHSEQMSG